MAIKRPSLSKFWYLGLLAILLFVIVMVLSGIIEAQVREDRNDSISEERERSKADQIQQRKSPNQNAAASALIIQDELPWGYDAIPYILYKHGVVYDEITSYDIETTNLSSYELIIIPSAQNDSFYTNWNNNIDEVETYVENGGKLWLSTCAAVSTNPKPLDPGGAISASDLEVRNVVIDPVHPWMWGAPENIFGGPYASYVSMTDLYPGSRVLARAQSTGKAVVVDYNFGSGQVFLSGMPLEITYQHHWNAKPILVNSLTRMLGLNPTRALVIQDTDPWGSTAIPVTLDELNVGYAVIDSSTMDSIDLRPYDVVIIPSGQSASFYETWNSNFPRFQNYVNGGSKLWISTANLLTDPEPLLPGGVLGANNLEIDHLVVEPYHPWMRGAPEEMYVSQAYLSSNSSFSDLVASSTILVQSRNSGVPTLVDYTHGDGRVMLSGLALEYGWLHDHDDKAILKNSLQDLLGIPFFVDMPTISDPSCIMEREPNDRPEEANGPITFGTIYCGSPDDNGSDQDNDYFYFELNCWRTLRIKVSDYLEKAAVILRSHDNIDKVLASEQDQHDGIYELEYEACSQDPGEGKYYIQIHAPPNHDEGIGDYKLRVTVN